VDSGTTALSRFHPSVPQKRPNALNCPAAFSRGSEVLSERT
jgi:hypothetical protein